MPLSIAPFSLEKSSCVLSGLKKIISFVRGHRAQFGGDLIRAILWTKPVTLYPCRILLPLHPFIHLTALHSYTAPSSRAFPLYPRKLFNQRFRSSPSCFVVKIAVIRTE